MTYEDVVIIDQACGCKVTRQTVSNNTTLHLCAWHSRWIRKANSVAHAIDVPHEERVR